MSKYYFSRAQTRVWSSEYPVGDPTGGAAYGEKNDPVTAIIGSTVVSSLLGSEASSNAAQTAAQASGAASDASVGEQRRQFDLSRADQQPFLTAGTGAVNRLGAGVAPGGEFGAAMPFNFQYSEDPGAAFRMSEGIKALDRSAASRGGLLSGATMKGAQRYGQDLASQEYNNAFNRYVTGFNANTGERNQLYNRLAGVAGTGQTTAGQLASQGANMASNIGNAYMTSAANTGNAAMAAAGQRQSAFGGAANVLGRMYGPQGGSNPYTNAGMASQQYGSGNVYGYGGGGAAPSAFNPYILD
jgi:hypothetical protein